LILRRDEENVAWAQAIPFGQRYVWPYAQVSDHLEDGKAQVEIRTVVKDTGISDFLRSTGESPAEIIGVGLESSDGGDPKDEIRQLSIDRAINLLAAVSQAIELPHTPKRIYYRQLGLGRARRSELKESEPERKQRSALVIVVAFLRQDTATQSTEQTLETLLRRLPLQQINLMDYEFSYAMAERMGERLAIGSAPRGDRWEHPPITVEQAIARRPKDSGAN
jgi:hypothetical protein